MSSPLTPPSSTTQGTRVPPLPASSSAQAPQQVPTFCKADEYLVKHLPGYKPMTKDKLEHFLRGLGATDETMEQFKASFDHSAERMTGPTGPGIRVIGVKPRPDDANVYTVAITGTDLLIRMWEGGMDPYAQFCLDFFDRRLRTPVNLPPGYAIHPASANMPGVFAAGGPLASWEQAFGYTPDKIPPGEEKWSVPAGAYLSVVKDGREVVTFAVPLTQNHQGMMARVVQPTLGYRY